MLSPSDDPLRILVVDDDQLTVCPLFTHASFEANVKRLQRSLMSRLLTKLGCVVETANDGKQFLDILLGPLGDGVGGKSYDLVSLDNQMPILSGESIHPFHSTKKKSNCVFSGEEAIRHLRSKRRNDLVIGMHSPSVSCIKTDTLMVKMCHGQRS